MRSPPTPHSLSGPLVVLGNSAQRGHPRGGCHPLSHAGTRNQGLSSCNAVALAVARRTFVRRSRPPAHLPPGETTLCVKKSKKFPKKKSDLPSCKKKKKRDGNNCTHTMQQKPMQQKPIGHSNSKAAPRGYWDSQRRRIDLVPLSEDRTNSCEEIQIDCPRPEAMG